METTKEILEKQLQLLSEYSAHQKCISAQELELFSRGMLYITAALLLDRIRTKVRFESSDEISDHLSAFFG